MEDQLHTIRNLTYCTQLHKKLVQLSCKICPYANKLKENIKYSVSLENIIPNKAMHRWTWEKDKHSINFESIMSKKARMIILNYF